MLANQITIRDKTASDINMINGVFAEGFATFEIGKQTNHFINACAGVIK